MAYTGKSGRPRAIGPFGDTGALASGPEGCC